MGGGGPLQVVMHRLQIGKTSDTPVEPRKGFRARAKQHFTNIIHHKPAQSVAEAVKPVEGIDHVSNGDSFRSSASNDSQRAAELSSQHWDMSRSGEGMDFDFNHGVDSQGDSTRFDEREVSFPEDFVCPFSNMLMADPVLLASGATYERANIRAYLDLGYRECFKTGETLHHFMLTKNAFLKKAIDRWCDSQRISRPVSPDAGAALDLVNRVCRGGDTSSSTFTTSSTVEMPTVSEHATSRDSSEGGGINLSPEHFTSSTPASARTRSSGSNRLWPQQIFEMASVQDNDLSPSSERLQNRERLLEARHHTWSGDKPRKLSQVLSNTISLRRDFASNYRFESSPDEEGSSPPPSSPERPRTSAGPIHSGQSPWGSRRGRDSTFPLPLTTTPSAFSDQPSSSGRSPICLEGLSESETTALIQKLQHMQTLEKEEAVKEIRQLTRDSVQDRLALCEVEFLEVLFPLMHSRYSSIQINAVATVLNLSLEKENKLKVARAGAIPVLIDVLKSGHHEAQEHAAGTLFSLAIHEDNKTAMGVLGAIPPLIHVLRTGTEGARRDSAMALYQLSFSPLNRSKLIKSGGVGIFLGIARDERSDIVSRALLILCNVAAMPEGRVALSEMNAVQVLVSLLTKGDDGEQHLQVNWPEVREQAAAALLQLSHHNVRFKSQAMQANALEGLQRLLEDGTPRARAKASSLLTILRDAPRTDDELHNKATIYRRSYIPSYRRVQDDKADSAQF